MGQEQNSDMVRGSKSVQMKNTVTWVYFAELVLLVCDVLQSPNISNMGGHEGPQSLLNTMLLVLRLLRMMYE